MSKRPGQGNIMLQARRMQSQIKQLQEQLEEQSFEGAAGGGLVKVSVSGRQKVQKIEITEEAINPDDAQQPLGELADLLTAALNMALSASQDTSQGEMKKITGGLNLPGLF